MARQRCDQRVNRFSCNYSDALEGSICTFCEEGELLRDSFKGNDAVICDACGTPGAQVW
ncbi:HVO_A0556 family zinc finger protein [Natrinema longum]|uniref:HVO_A0556 family zinc finger protein n=1 Tax=Natrinema longum TaxID=370324 RepID=UPI003CE523E6